jgi:hypothetical protein
MKFIGRTGDHRHFVGAALALAALVLVCASGRARADDWEAVPSDSAQSGTPAAPAVSAAPASRRPSHRSTSAPADTTPEASDAAPAVVNACGEAATAPSEQIATIVDQINHAWGSDVHVYQSVAPEGPHALAGGCIFYNAAEMAVLLGVQLDVRDADRVEPMLYAIFAHEVGHEDHGDFDASRAAVPNKTKELEADRFAGYTMQKLGVPATGLAPYWSMTGDEFSRGHSHGGSEERVASFKEGWHLAQWNRAEDSQPTASAGQESTAPDDASDNAP